MGSRRRAQSPSSVNKTSQLRLACVFRQAHPAPWCGYKGRVRANAQQLFASEPSLANLQSVCKARLTALVLRPFSARNRPSASSVLTTLDGGAAQGYVEVPPVECAIAMQLCPQGAAAWRGKPRLPSRACKFSFALTAKAYGAAGQAASALHAMALLQVHQAKALKQLHEGDADPGVLQELRTATDLALRATKVTARALGQTMSTLVVQERHLWLTLADMRESDKHHFLDSPISQAGLFGEAVEDFAQQFSAAQKQTEAFGHILPRRSAAVSTPPPAAAPPSARRRGRPPAASTMLQLGHNSSLHYGRSVELAAGDRRSPPPPLPSP